MNILVYIDLQSGEPAGIAREMLAGARELAGEGGRVDAALFGADPSAIAGLGADRVLTVPAIAGTAYNPAVHAACLTAAVETASPDLVMMGYTTMGLDLGPVVAARKKMPLFSYCSSVSVDGATIDVDSQIYGGKLVSNAKADLPALVMVNAGVYREADEPIAGDAEVVALDAPAGIAETGVEFQSASAPDPDAVDITKADRLLCVGRGIGDESAIEDAREVANLMQAELVGSRPIVDAGWLAKERQVGKSGRKVKPGLYMALGVSGAPEHIEGMGDSGFIVAINTDQNAPIFDYAHIGANVDLADFLPALQAAFQNRGG
jgi:electron transfer flavoprotein alpha subunit